MSTYRATVDRADETLKRWLDDLGNMVGRSLATIIGATLGVFAVLAVLLVVVAVLTWAWRTVF